MIEFDMEELEEVIKCLMIEKFGSVEAAVKVPVAIKNRIYKEVNKFLREKYGCLIGTDSDSGRDFTSDIKTAYTQTVRKIIEENK